MDELENSLGDDATFAGGARESLSGISLGDEGTLGDVSTEQAAVVDDIEIVDIGKKNTRYINLETGEKIKSFTSKFNFMLRNGVFIKA